MSFSRRPYRYPLEPLRARREWERDARRQELARLEARLAEQRERLALSERRLAEARQEWQQRVAGAERIDPALHRLAAAFFAESAGNVASQQQQVSKTLAARQEAAARALGAQRLLDGIERHRGAGAAAHRRAEQARELGALDAAWVERHAGSEGRK